MVLKLRVAGIVPGKNGVTSAVLDALLEPLWPFLRTPDLIEMSVIKPKEIGLEIAGQGYQFVEAPLLDYDYWRLLSHVLANINGVAFSTSIQPRISTALPGGHRFEGMLGKNVDEKLSISIRMKRNIQIKLESFGIEGEIKEKILSMIREGANMLVSGGTSSGKTTFLNQLIRFIPDEKRILTVEDTRELSIPHLNQKSYIVSRNETKAVIGYSEIIDHLVRSRPDVIIAGEVSVANAFPIVRMLNSGHSGFMSTVHANTPELALTAAIPQNIQLAGLNPNGIGDLLYQTLDIVLQLHRTDKGKREVTEILFPKLKERKILHD